MSSFGNRAASKASTLLAPSRSVVPAATPVAACRQVASSSAPGARHPLQQHARARVSPSVANVRRLSICSEVREVVLDQRCDRRGFERDDALVDRAAVFRDRA